MDELQDIGTTEAIDPQSMDLDVMDSYEGEQADCCTPYPVGYGDHYSGPTTTPAGHYGYQPDNYGMYGSSPHGPWQMSPQQGFGVGYGGGGPMGGGGSYPPPPAYCSGYYYTVRPGDSLFSIAQRTGVSLDALIRANPQITDPSIIYPGQVICIPAVADAVRCPGGTLYTVQPGDSLWFISQRYGISLQALIRANPQIADPNLIYPGQVICIPKRPGPGPGPPPPPTRCTGWFYTVRPGDTIYSIGARFAIRPRDILRASPQITDPDLIYPGQVICIPLPPPPPCREGTLYTVKSGDTLSGIARRFNTTVRRIMAANPQIVDPDVIYVGQRICIPKYRTSDTTEATDTEVVEE